MSEQQIEIRTLEFQDIKDSIDALTAEIRSLKEIILKGEGPTECVSEVNPYYNQTLFVSILSLAKEGSISACVSNALIGSGIQYVSDFEFVALSELHSIKGLHDKDIIALLQLLEERFELRVSNSKRICAEFKVGDLVKFIPSGFKSLSEGQTLKVISVDYSPIVPKYTCTTTDGSSSHHILSPSLLSEWTI